MIERGPTDQRPLGVVLVRTYVAVARRARACTSPACTGSGHRAGSGGDRDGHFVVAALARTL